MHWSAPLASEQTGALSEPLAREGAFRFDTGPSLLLFPDTYRETYRSLGQDIEDHVQVIYGLGTMPVMLQ